MLSNSSGAEISSSPPGGRPPLLAHRGFLARARSIPIQQLYAEARARGKRLVLTGEWPAVGRRLEGLGGLEVGLREGAARAVQLPGTASHWSTDPSSELLTC